MPSDLVHCDYCPRLARAFITLGQPVTRRILGLPPRRRRVCTDHLTRKSRPVGRHG